jgi:hypothetical protein
MVITACISTSNFSELTVAVCCLLSLVTASNRKRRILCTTLIFLFHFQIKNSKLKARQVGRLILDKLLPTRV